MHRQPRALCEASVQPESEVISMPIATIDSRRLAQLIVADSLRFSFRIGGGGEKEVESALSRLRSPEGPSLTQAMLGQYCGVDTGEVAPSLDRRIAYGSIGAIRIAAQDLQAEMDRELANSLSMTADERDRYIQEFGELG
jgi:hypothetical protein